MPSNRFFMGSNVMEYWNHDRLIAIQDKLLSGQQPEECQYCWDAEAANLKTHRIQNDSKHVHQIHVRLNNVCNFKCRMCNPKFSSSWEIENRKHGYFEHDYQTQKDVFDYDPNLLPFITALIKAGHLRFLNISGGEPLITDANYKLLSHLIKEKATNVTLAYSSNLSKLDYKNHNLLGMWAKFDKVLVEASCDGWGDAVEYSRTGFDRKTFLKNLHRARQYINRINCVVNVYSVWTLPHIEKICEKTGIKPVYAPCFLPDFLNPQHLLKEDKDSLFELYKPYPRLLQVYKDYIAKDMPTLGKEMVEYNLMLDEYRGSDFFNVFPQYEKYNALSS